MQTRLPNHGGLTPPALVLVYGRLRAKKRFLRCANAHSQERRALARRGSVTHLQRRFVEATGRRNRRVAVSLLQSRLANHGWLTPAAPPCMPECRRKDASSIHQHASSTTAGLRQPLLVHVVPSLQHARFATCRRACNQERRASARRGSVNRTSCGQNRVMLGDWPTQNQQRRTSARRGSVTHLQRRFVEATGRRNRRVAVSLLQTRLANHG